MGERSSPLLLCGTKSNLATSTGDMIWDLGATNDRGDVGMYAGIVVCDILTVIATIEAHYILLIRRVSLLGCKP